MRTILILSLMLSANGALAHVGHVAEAAGHNHWVAGVVIGAAVLAGIYGALKGKSRGEDPDDEEPTEEVAA